MRLAFVIVIFSSFLSCQKTFERNEYESWLLSSENALLKKVNVGDYDIQVLYEPAEYQLMQGYKSGIPENMDDVLNSYRQKTAFTLRVSHSEFLGDFIIKQISNESEYAQLKKYMDFDLQHDIYLVKGLDTIDCALYHTQRGYGLTPFRSTSIVFETSQDLENIQLIINDKKIGFGKVKFYYKKSDLSDLPQLKNSHDE